MADRTMTDRARPAAVSHPLAAFDSRPPVVAVASPKGGSGKTTVAVNLAVALARRAPTVLIDLDVAGGDVEWALKSRPIHRLDDVVHKVAMNEVTDIEALLTPHTTLVDVLCAPDTPIIADQLSPVESFVAIDRLIDLRRPVVLDTASSFTPFTVGALDRATHVMLVSGTDVASVHAARKLKETMAKLAMDVSRIRLVINKANPRIGLAPADVEQALGVRASLVVPDLAAIAAAGNRGVPIVEAAPRSRVARRFLACADNLLANEREEIPQ